MITAGHSWQKLLKAPEKDGYIMTLKCGMNDVKKHRLHCSKNRKDGKFLSGCINTNDATAIVANSAPPQTKVKGKGGGFV